MKTRKDQVPALALATLKARRDWLRASRAFARVHDQVRGLGGRTAAPQKLLRQLKAAEDRAEQRSAIYIDVGHRLFTAKATSLEGISARLYVATRDIAESMKNEEDQLGPFGAVAMLRRVRADARRLAAASGKV